MMVWIVIKNVNNGVDSWTTVYDVFVNDTDAEHVAHVLNEVADKNTEYYVEGWHAKRKYDE